MQRRATRLFAPWRRTTVWTENRIARAKEDLSTCRRWPIYTSYTMKGEGCHSELGSVSSSPWRVCAEVRQEVREVISCYPAEDKRSGSFTNVSNAQL